ncbi:hypothetical protein [Olivibacter domesticus]|uniref:Uncharacterized protein n=1 Tax=Olivibacter domesticus TaxID=407022 RepID=A0A1H7IBE9_OLID1|nr:hypothetical protein [Olivibacter domesticus]SEK59799.1 hypothetical protein SAMN05661044_00646 [Olivibacter domesticus]
MKNELLQLENFIVNELMVYIIANREIPQAFYEEKTTYLDDNNILYKERILDLLSSSEETHVIERLIQTIHNRMVHLSDLLYGLDKSKRQLSRAEKEQQLSSKTQSLVQHTQQFIIEFLSFLETTFPQQMSKDGKFPDFRLQLLLEELTPAFSKIIRRFRKVKTEPVFIDSLQDFYQHFSEQSARTYRSVLYLQKIVRGLESLQHRWKADQWESQLWQLLLYLNFNREAIMRHATERVRMMNSEENSPLENKERLLFWLKETKQTEQNQEWSYDASRSALKDHLILQLEMELNWLQEQEDERDRVSVKDHANYFTIDLTVKQINLWATINVAIKRIPYHSPLHVIKVINSFLRTTRTGPISYDSARKKISDFDSTTVQGLYQYFKEQLRELETRYGHLLSPILITAAFHKISSFPEIYLFL